MRITQHPLTGVTSATNKHYVITVIHFQDKNAENMIDCGLTVLCLNCTSWFMGLFSVFLPVIEKNESFKNTIIILNFNLLVY
jgi:hypothetical protein